MNRRVSLNDARAAKPKASQAFRRLVGDVAVGIVNLGDHGYGLKVNLATPPEAGITLPGEIEGVPIRIEIVGAIRKR